MKNSFDTRTFASELYAATDFDSAFHALQNTAWDLGFDGVLYTFIPRILLDTKFHVQPVYKVSEQFCPEFLSHYAEAQFEKVDPLIKAVADGVSSPISWQGQTIKNYEKSDPNGREVMRTANDYGINNGVTLPLLSGAAGISGASFITSEKNNFEKIIDVRLDSLNLCTRLFHQLVQSNITFKKEFVTTFLETLNTTEIRTLIGLASGKSSAQIASELKRTERYLEQVITKLRRKFSGVGPHDTPIINRNQLLYYAGLLEVMQYQH